MPVDKDEKIKDLLQRGVEEIIPGDHLRQALLGRKKLRIKLGIDPTSPNIHIGNAVVLWKLRTFQELGHQVVLIVGDFTGLIGDTSDKESERPMLTEKEVVRNMKTYFYQAFKILDKAKTETHRNSEWLKKLGFAEIGFMADLFGWHEFSAREVIKRRLNAGKRVSLREGLYPLMQGYDSVAVRADVELGGSDQRFNLLAGRTIQQAYGQPQQDILTVELLEGLDGRKMSSSWSNGINLIDSPADMFGKVMSLRDDLIERYFVLATRLPEKEIKQILKSNANPRDQKLVLALAITELYHGAKKAQQAKQEFMSVFSKKEKPLNVKIVSKGKVADLAELLVRYNLAGSKSEARRLVDQSGVKIDDKTITDWKTAPKLKSGSIIQVGKRKFVRIK